MCASWLGKMLEKFQKAFGDGFQRCRSLLLWQYLSLLLWQWYLMDGKYVAALLYIAAAICLLISWTYPVDKCGDSDTCIRWML
jgi:hypothetical protein